MINSNCAYLLAAESTGIWKRHGLAFLAQEYVEAIVSTDEYIAVMVLTEVVGLYIMKEIFIAKRVEGHILWIQTGDTVRCPCP